MSNAKVRRAIAEIRKYYARNEKNPYFNLKRSDGKASNTSDDPNSRLDDFDKYIRPDNENIIKNFMDRLTTKAETAAGAKSIVERSKDLSDNVPPLIVTPGGDAIGGTNGSPLANTSKGKKTRQGTRVPDNGDFYTFADAAGIKQEEAVNVNVSVLQIFSPVDSITASDTDIATFYMNSITSLEASRAVPYIDVTVAASVGNHNETRPMSLGRFLGVIDRRDLLPGTADHALAYGQPVISIRTDLNPDRNEQVAILAGMEAFTTPQTLVNADVAYSEWLPNGKVKDPFQPLLSLESMKLSVRSGGGFMAQRTGEIVFILHDRARMDEISTLLAPGQYGKARLIITYGYAHPDGSRYGTSTNSELLSNPFGEIVDNMRMTEVFMVSTIAFSFENSVVKLTLQIAPVGSSDINTMDIVLADGDDEDINNIKTSLATLNQQISQKNETAIKQITVPSYMSNPNSISGNGLTDEQLRTFNEFRKNTQDDTAIANMLVDLFGEEGKSGRVNEKIKNKNAKIDSLFERMTSTPDPFLPMIDMKDLKTESYIWDGNGPPANNTNQYVSLGKAISTFLGNSLRKSNNINFAEGDEIQIVFHPFNRDAGGMQDYNVSQFVIEVEDLKKVLKDRFDLTGRMSVAKFLEILKQSFVSDLGSVSYGLLTNKERQTYKLDPATGKRSKPEGVRVRNKAREQSEIKEREQNAKNSRRDSDDLQKDPKASNEQKKAAEDRANADEIASNVTQPIRYTSVPFKGPDYDEALESGKKRNLREIYGSNEYAEVVFRPPNLQFIVESMPKAVRFDDEPQFAKGIVLRINVADSASTPMATVAEVIRGAGTSGIIPIVDRRTDPESFPYTSAHAAYSAFVLADMVRQQILLPLDRNELEDINEKENDNSKLEKGEIEGIMRNYLIFNRGVANVKDLIKSTYPTLTYGSSTSGLLSAKFSAEADSQLANIMLVRAGKNLNKSDDKDGVPVGITPASVTLETLGCPYFSFTQFYYLDLGTNTDVDNVYGITTVDHDIQPGKFTTSLKLTITDAFGSFRPLKDEMSKTFLGAFLAKFKKPATPAPAQRGRAASRNQGSAYSPGSTISIGINSYEVPPTAGPVHQ